MATLAASKLLYFFTYGAQDLLAAMGHVRHTATIVSVEAILNLALSLVFVLVFDFGLVGVALGTLVARLIVPTVWLPWLACRKAGIRWSDFLVRIGGNTLVTGILFAAVCLAILWFSPTESWTTFTVQVVLAIMCYVPIAVMLLVPKDDRVRLGQLIGLVSRVTTTTHP
jgi:O-antigen/teichoic acid export membrane protein